MAQYLNNLVTASVHGSIVILAVILLRLVLRKTPKKYICLLWLLAGIRLLMPIEIRSDLSLQPEFTLPGWNLPAILPWVWGIVAMCFGIYSLVSYRKLKAKVREAVRIRGGWECDRIDTAFILGFIKHRIYIPMGMTRQARKHILEHERTHLDKGDHWIKMIGFLALALHWFNPLVWVAYIMLSKDIEMACDERVVQFMELEERKSYSAALLSCSGKQMHLSANPVAFGEVSVKQRILSVLNYKKPSFWISMLGVVAFFFVAVCLVTSPAEENIPTIVEVPATEAPVEEPAEETREPSTFATNLKREDIAGVCAESINQLIAQENYLISCEYSYVYPNRENQNYDSYSVVRRYGQDQLTLVYDSDDYDIGSSVLFGDMYGLYYGDFWVLESNRSELRNNDPNNWLDRYSPAGDEVFFPEGTGVISEDTVSFRMAWCEETLWGTEEYEGTFTYRFNNDGSVAEIYCEYEQLPTPEYSEEEICHYTTRLIIHEEEPADTYKAIADHAGQCVYREQLEILRKEQKKTTEIPSNKTDYDRDYSLGSASMRWHFFNEEWQFAYGAENATATGLTLICFESGEGHKALTAGEGFWLEELMDGRWVVLDPTSPVIAAEKQINVSWTGRDTLAVDWSDSYGNLEQGYYRIGRYYTVTMNDGRTETNHCYAKFQIRNQDLEALLTECETGLEKLLSSTDYYLKNWDYLRNEEFHNRIDADSHDMVTEIWRSGNDFYQEITYRYKSDSSTKDIIAYLLRDGKKYCASGEVRIQTMEDAEFAVVDWLNQDNFELWSRVGLSFSATDLVEAYKDQAGIIHVKESTNFYDGIPYKEQRYSFNSDGMLVWYQRLFYNEAGEEIVDFKLEVYRTAEGETRQKIDSIPVS